MNHQLNLLKTEEGKENNKIEHKRMRSRIRSQRARDRKKVYIETLEKKVTDLEIENFRLQNLLAMYRSQELNRTTDESKNLMKELQDYKNDFLSEFIDSESGKYNEKVPISAKESFNQINYPIYARHKKFLEHNFEMIYSHF